MSHIFIEPGRSNSSAAEEGHWKIMISENEKTRHLNDATSHADAFEKARRAAAKRNIAFNSEVKEVTKGGVVEPPAPVVKKDYMDVQPPRGAPKKGKLVRFKAPDGSIYEGEVVDYLAEQFVIEYVAPTQRVVHMNEDWSEIG